MMSKSTPFLAIICITIIFSAFLSQPLSAQQASEEHTVQSGETLFSIARDYELTVGDLRRWNNLDVDELSSGQILRIAPPKADNQITHTVQAGETLFALSRKYGVTIAEIQEWNNFRDNNLEVGRELIIFQDEDQSSSQDQIPVLEQVNPDEERRSIVRVSEAPSGNSYYNVRSGDTLYKIANDHSMTVNELRQLNNLEDDMLRVGQRLTVRETGSSAPSIAEGDEESTPQGRFAQYRVQSGENGNAVIEKFQMSESEFFSLNPGNDLNSIGPGQRVTVLMPPTRNFKNPYRKGASLEDLGSVSVFKYSENDVASTTTSGELYNPDQLTAAHSNMALGNVIYIENPTSGNGVFVRINDRHSGDGLKLSDLAFNMLDFSSIEQARVTIYLDN